MHLFSELYNCYYQVIHSLLLHSPVLTEETLQKYVSEIGYEESMLFLIPKLMSGEWDLLKKEDALYLSKLSDDFSIPLSTLQLSFLKALLQDEKACLFLNEDALIKLSSMWPDIPPLWSVDDFYYYDRFTDSDDFGDSDYIHTFRTILSAIKDKRQMDVTYRTKSGRLLSTRLLPCRLEYSMRNDKFRLLAMEHRAKKHPSLHILNLDRIEKAIILNYPPKRRITLNHCIRKTYYKDPARILIKDERNALERTMLQFANYEKNTKKIDHDTYECLIYYNKNSETELLIELLSFGPLIKVVGNEEILAQLKERLRLQRSLLA